MDRGDQRGRLGVTIGAHPPHGGGEPHNLEAERSVLGACLLHADAVPEVSAILRPSDFYIPRHATIFRALLATHAQDGATDPIAVGEELKRLGRMEEAGGHNHLLDLMECVVTAAGVQHHAEIVKDYTRRRSLLTIARALQAGVADGMNSTDLAGEMDRQLREVLAPRSASSGLSPSDIIDRWTVDGPLIHVPTGIRALDQMTGGGPTFGCRVFLAGAPDGGKTGLLVQIANSYLDQGLVVGLLVVDEDPSDVFQRFLQRGGVARHQCEQREAADIEEMRRLAEGLRVRFYNDAWTIEAAAKDLAAYAQKAGAGAMLGIDSVQTVRCDAEESESSRHEAVTARVRAIRTVTDKYRLITVTTSEVGRASYRSNKPDERINDLAAGKESGSIEYSARVLLVLRSVEDESDLVEIRVAKNKLGPIHRNADVGIHLRIDRARQIFTEVNHVPQPETTQATVRTGQRDHQTNQDAARVAGILTKQPGVLAKRCEELASGATPGRMGHSRYAAARGRLGEGLVERPGKATSKLLYIDGSKVPPSVIAEVPPEDRPRVLGARPPQENHDSNEAPRPAPTRPRAPRGASSTMPERDAPAPLKGGGGASEGAGQVSRSENGQTSGAGRQHANAQADVDDHQPADLHSHQPDGGDA